MWQLRTTKTEKYAHVTYFFNGGRETPFEGEDRQLLPSPRDVATYDQKPEILSLGFSNFRVRVYKDAARLQLSSEEIEDAAKNKEAIRARIGAYFDEILLDLDGR